MHNLIRYVLTILLTVNGFSSLFAQQDVNPAKLSPRLQDTLRNRDTGDLIRVGILLADRVDMEALDDALYRRKASLQVRSQTVIDTLRRHARQSQQALIAYLQQSGRIPPGGIEKYWITNMLFVHATRSLIEALSLRADIAIMDLDVPAKLMDPVPTAKRDGPLRRSGSREPGLEAVHAPMMWQAGYTGYGRKAMSMDTGVDPHHPAIKDNFHGLRNPLAESWYVYEQGASEPGHCGGHGTHTVGTMMGLDRATEDTIGMAFGAYWIGSPNLCGGGTSSNIAAFEWALDPDSNAATVKDRPDVINNSWYDSGLSNECNSIYKSTFDALEAAGIAVVFSAGNEGPDDTTITPPKNINTNIANAFTVGAVNGNNSSYPIASFSSRGPSVCGSTGSLLIKPEVSAPGVSVRSSYTDPEYDYLSGTSMAAPHVAGAVLLLKEAFPYLTGKEIKEALYFNCTDLGDIGEDNNYGMGIINVWAAYNDLLNQGHEPMTYAYDASVECILEPPDMNCDTLVEPVFVLKNRGVQPLTSVQVHYGFDADTVAVLSWMGNLAPGDTAHLHIPPEGLPVGTHTLLVHVIQPNEMPDERTFNNKCKQRFVIPNYPLTDDVPVCRGNAVTLHAAPAATPAGIRWYANPSDSLPFTTQNSWTSDEIAEDTAYYVDIRATSKVGIRDMTTGDGSFHNNPGFYLRFDADRPFTLKSVRAFTGSEGERTFELRDSNEVVLEAVTTFLPQGSVRVPLNFEVPPGRDYQLGFSDAPDMYRHRAGVAYPYTVPGIMAITGSNAGSSRYYYCYDWEVVHGSGCGITKVQVHAMDSLDAFFLPDTHQVNIATRPEMAFTDQTILAAEWHWDFGDGNISNIPHPTHHFGYPGTYPVQLTAYDSSGTCKGVYTDTITAFKPKQAVVFPNPSNGMFYVDLELNEPSHVTATLYDIHGRQLAEMWQGEPPSTLFTLDLQHLADGMYLLQVYYETEERVEVYKLVKH